MNPFAKPEESTTYEYVEFPAPPPVEVAHFEANSTSGSFIDFLTFKDLPVESTTPTVQTALFQDFKEILPPAQEA